MNAVCHPIDDFALESFGTVHFGIVQYNDGEGVRTFLCRELIERFYNGLYWLGHPLDTMYEAEAFFDTNFHLVDEARLEYTQQLVNWLGSQPFIGCKAFYEALENRQ